MTDAVEVAQKAGLPGPRKECDGRGRGSSVSRAARGREKSVTDAVEVAQ